MVLPILTRSPTKRSGEVSDNSTQKQRRFNIQRLLVTLLRRRKSTLLGLMLLAFCAHRFVAFRRWHMTLIKAPINHISRSCDEPTYKIVDQSVAQSYKICMTTLTDAKKGTWLHKMIRWRNFDDLLELTWPNKQSYASHHGYYLFDESSTLDTLRPPSWSKIKAAQRLLTEEKCDWVFWLDADTVIMNPFKKIEAFLPEKLDILFTTQKGKSYNAGAWLIRNSKWSLHFLQHWWDMVDFVQPPGLSTSGDNAALKHYLLNEMNSTEFREHIGVPPRCTFNSLTKWVSPSQVRDFQKHPEKISQQEWYMASGAYHQGDFVAHVAGKDNKVDTVRELLLDVLNETHFESAEA